MKVSKKQVLPVFVGSFLMLAGMSAPALAYGPEGLFGGRSVPDSTITVPGNVEPEDRPQRTQSVIEHPRPDFDPVPLAAGSFNIYPSAEFGAAYDSNIYADKKGSTSDAVFNFRPMVNAVSNWNRNALAVSTYGDINFYRGHSKEDFNNFVADVRGRYDVMAQTWISGHGGFQRVAIPRSSPNDAGGSEPGHIDVYKGGVGGHRGLGVLSTDLDYDFSRLNFSSIPTSSGLDISQSAQDRNEHTLTAKVGYKLSQNIQPYVRGAYNIRDYQTGTVSNSDGYEIVAGTSADLGGITSTDVYVGWLSQDYYKSPVKKVNDAVKFGGKFEWNITQLTSLALEANRTIEETTATGFNSYLASGGSATLTHELLRNLLVEANMSFTRDDYHGTGNRQDDTLTAGAGTRWYINRNLYSDFIYNWSQRSSSTSAVDYNKHVVSLRVGVQF